MEINRHSIAESRWGDHPLILALERTDPSLQLCVVKWAGGDDMQIVWLNEAHRARWGDLEGKVCFEEYNAFQTKCHWCPCTIAIERGTCQQGLAFSPVKRPGQLRPRLEYSSMQAVPLERGPDVSYVLEMIIVVNDQEQDRIARARQKSILISKLFGILSQCYGSIGLDLMLATLVAPDGFGYEAAYLHHVDQDDGLRVRRTDYIRRADAERLGDLTQIPGLDDALAIARFHDEHLIKLVNKRTYDEPLPLIVPRSGVEDLRDGRLQALEAGLKSAVVSISCEKTGLNAYLQVDHGDTATFLTGTELSELSLVAAACAQAIALGAMSSSLYQMSTRLLGKNYDEAVVGLAQMMALTRVHELRGAWTDFVEGYKALEPHLPGNVVTRPEYQDVLRTMQTAERYITDHLGRLKQLRRMAGTTWRSKRVNVVQKLSDVVDKRRPEAAHYGINLRISPPSGTAWAMVDADNLGIAFDNIISNAIYFVNAQHGSRKTGRIDVTWEIAHDIAVTVRDNGPGILPGERSLVFVPFHSTKGKEGLGLGLAMTQLIVEKCSGTLHVHSQPGKWTEFTVRLPVANKPDGAKTEP